MNLEEVDIDHLLLHGSGIGRADSMGKVEHTTDSITILKLMSLYVFSGINKISVKMCLKVLDRYDAKYLLISLDKHHGHFIQL